MNKTPLSLLLVGLSWLMLLTPIPGFSQNGAKAVGKDFEIIGTLNGKVKFAGDAASQGGIVSFFKVDGSPEPDQLQARKVPFKISTMNNDGSFSVKLPAGPYHMGAMQWQKGRRPGPPRPGEVFMFIYDGAKNLQVIESKAGKTTEIGELTGWTPEQQKESDPANSLVIWGTVRKENSEPFPVSVVLLKDKLNSEKPLYVSNPTREDGKYHFVVPPGKYYLIARQGTTMVGRPRPGTFMGAYGQQEAIGAGGKGGSSQAGAWSVSGEKGEVLKEIDITMFALPDPEELQEKTKKLVGAQQIEKPAHTPLKDNSPMQSQNK